VPTSIADIDPDRIKSLNAVGMLPSLYAELKPEGIAVDSPRGTRSFRQLNETANQLARVMRRAGLKRGDHFALLCPNTPEFIEVAAMNLRGGYRMIPVNWHLKPDEVRYIVENSDAKALIAHADFGAAAAYAAEGARLRLRLVAGGEFSGFEAYEAALAAESKDDIPDPTHGTQMLYTSGTTGRPKGVIRPGIRSYAPQWGPRTRKAYAPDTDRSLCCGPAYHGAPLSHTVWDPLVAGVPIVLMEKFTAEGFLSTVETHRVTHTAMVSTMFQRLLALPREVRESYDVSSLRYVIHGAAPTPPEAKRAMIDWLGPVVHEYFGATEGSGNYYITAEEWLRKPGSVGRRDPDWGSRVLNDNNEDAAPGEIGRIFFKHPEGRRFSYYGDPEKSEASTLNGTHFTLGDMGYFDEDDYLFLTGRTAECIISGGVNIYPQEIDNQLLKHPAVEEACTIGVPNDEWGEEVRAVIALKPGFGGDAKMAQELIDFIRPHLASYKLPKTIDFAAEIPRSAAGKVQRAQVRAPYWAGRTKQI
jgi:long-chain acyl-CoA synthetase